MNYSRNEEERKEAEALCKRQDKMRSDRMMLESHWQECADYIIPRKSDLLTVKQQGDKRGGELFDTTAIMANALLAGALHSMLTNQTSKFFDLIMGDPQLDDNDDVKGWLQEVCDRMHVVINNSNFQTEVHEVYIDLGSIGTACMYIAEHDDTVVHFSARAMKEIFILENNLGLVDTIHREFSWNLRQIVQEFGEEALTAELKRKYKDGVDDKFQIIHAVEPNEDKGSPFTFKSRYLLKEHYVILNRAGFRELPFVVPRWTKTSGETYGRGPGMDMLPDIKMVNKMMETTLKGAQITVSPPLMVQDDGVIGKVRLTSAGINIVRPGLEDPIKPLITNARIDFGYQAVEDVRKRIRSGFYVDQLQLNEGPQMTATEVNQRTEEKLRLMGPVLGRQHFEFLKPMIERVFGIMLRKNLIPPAPNAIKGKRFDVRYSSLVARVQRMSEGTNISRAIAAAAPIVNAKPQSLDNLDEDKAFQYIMDIHGVPQKILRKKREIMDMRKQRQQAEEQAAQEKAQMHKAEMVAKVGPTAMQAKQMEE